MKSVRHNIVYVLGFCVAVLCLSYCANAQSTDQNFPTPVTTNEIVGTIRARDIGDSRLTTYFYAFDGEQGDIFINVVTKNLSGDIDIFAADGLRPLTKMVVYSDADVSETGRLIYLRKPERMLLRVEGRSPGDEPATFRIKFGGSFVALKAVKSESGAKPIAKATKIENGIKVNSVGTIIEVIPKVVPVKTPQKEKTEVARANEAVSEKPKVKQPEVVITISDNTKAEQETPVVTEPAMATVEPVAKTVEPTPKPMTKRPVKPKANVSTSKPAPKKVETQPTAIEEKKLDPLANIRLVIQLKDGKMIERHLNEVLKFSVDNGVLTVIGKDGTIARYSMLLVNKVTIE